MSGREENVEKKHRTKMTAPIVITVLVVAYFFVYFGLLIPFIPGLFLKVLTGVLPALLGAAMIGVCIQRIREIKGGEEDDLSQY